MKVMFDVKTMSEIVMDAHPGETKRADDEKANEPFCEVAGYGDPKRKPMTAPFENGYLMFENYSTMYRDCLLALKV